MMRKAEDPPATKVDEDSQAAGQSTLVELVDLTATSGAKEGPQPIQPHTHTHIPKLNQASAPGEEDQRKKRGRGPDKTENLNQNQNLTLNRISHLMYSLVHLALWAQIGVLGRFWIGVAIKHPCQGQNQDQDGCSIPEKTVLDVLAIMTANIVGSFAMGFLTENKAHLLWFEKPQMPVSFLPENHFIQHYEELLTGLRVGFCGAMTTFSSWAFQLIWSLTRGHVGAALAILFVEISVSVVAFVLGEQLAIRIHMVVMGICHHHKRERTTLWHQLKKNAIFAHMPRPHPLIHQATSDRHQALSVVESHKGDQLWVLRRSSYKNNNKNKNKNNNKSDKNVFVRTERYNVSGTIVLDTPFLREASRAVDESFVLPTANMQTVVESLKPNTSDDDTNDDEDHDDEGLRLTGRGLTRSQHRTKIALNLFFTAWLLAQTALWACLLVYDKSFLRRQCWFSLLLAPIGCILRWRMCLDYNSGVLRGRLSWFPVGTFSINVSATVLNCVFSAVETHFCTSATHLYWLDVTLSGFKTGFCGSLSTVSTFVGEIHRYMLEYPRNYKGWLYFVASLVASVALGFSFYSWSVYTPLHDPSCSSS